MAEKNTKVEETTMENEGKDQSTGQKKKRSSGPITRTVAGSVLGATVGYLATPENGKKLLESIDQEKLKSKSREFGNAAKEKSRSAVTSLKTSTSNLFKRDKDHGDGVEERNETALNAAPTAEETQSRNEDYEALKQENEQLQERLQRLEDMLADMSEDDRDEDEEDEDEDGQAAKASEDGDEDEDDEETDADEDEEDDEDDAKNVKKTSKKAKNDEDEEDREESKKKTKSSSTKSKKRSTRTSSKSKKSSKNDDDEGGTTLSSDDDTSS
ncbi:hypothetical protein LCM10_08400 [Rossellomorea aquimaris]|uniref:YtxH domain-containing protein n=1 Tax=Rossellomorea aquimaris TaxID=189382 RepID=UPI001CD61AFB|nr:YtxH domain-containing protein [Rossellomorea aquimaris]MCA1055003.1 hypothetical protein [Rossellomorea aquimaris]